MEPGSSLNSAVVGCGPSGCFLLSLLRQSNSPARLVAVDDDASSLELAGAEQKVLVTPGESLRVDAGTAGVVFVVLDPAEGKSLDYAAAVAQQVSSGGAYVYALALNKPGSSLDERELARTFGGVALADAAWVLRKRGEGDEEKALHVAFNFAAHTLAFLAGALASGELEPGLFKDVTSGGVCSFAATHISEAETLYAMTLSKVEKDRVKAGIVFVEAGTDDVVARRIFLRVASGLPRESRLSMLRVEGLEPFKILAMLVH